MKSTFPPRLLQWDSGFLQQEYKSEKSVLVTAGCSFTASDYTDTPASWPGFMIDRVGFDHGIDLSSPGVGNEYITNSVVDYVERTSQTELDKTMIIVCWSGLDRLESLFHSKSDYSAAIENIHHKRLYNSVDLDPSRLIDLNLAKGEILRSWKNIILLQSYLAQKKISFGFSFYCNMFNPPFLPKRDLTPEFIGNLSQEKINSLLECNWIHPHTDCLFEFCFYNDCLSEDLFHPSREGYIRWVDQILLPNLLSKNLIKKINKDK